MEPFAVQQGISPSLRTGLSITGDLSAVLQEGRVVAGEVLQKMDGSTVLLGLGRHRVPADSQVEMPVGKRFFARVQADGDEVVLRVLGREGGTEPALLAALRSVVGEDRPIGDLLRELAGALRAALREGGPDAPRLERLLGDLSGHVFRPGSQGADLQALLARAGFGYETRLLGLGLTGGGATDPGAALQGLAQRLMAELGAGATTGEAASLASLGAGVQAALKRFLATLGRPPTPEGVEKLLPGLTDELRKLIESLPGGSARARLSAGLAGALQRLLGGAEGTALLARLLAAGDPRAQLQGNLKAQLLDALGGLEDVELRKALTRTVAGIESEQLLNLARREFHEALHLSFPVPDGERWATAHLFYRRGEEGSDERGPGEGTERLTLAVDFSELGPLRIDIGLGSDEVAVRILATSEEVARRLSAGLAELEQELVVGGRRVRVAILAGRSEEACVDTLAQDVRWLRENHLMDLSG